MYWSRVQSSDSFAMIFSTSPKNKSFLALGQPCSESHFCSCIAYLCSAPVVVSTQEQNVDNFYTTFEFDILIEKLFLSQ